MKIAISRFTSNCLIAFIFFILSLSSTAYSAIYYVDQGSPAADDSNSGTESSPWKTLKKAVQTVVAGDTVYVKPGTYIDSDTTGSSSIPGGFPVLNSGRAGKLIVFKSEPPGAAVVAAQPQPADPTRSRPAAWVITNKSYIVIDGFKVRGQLRLSNCKNMVIQNNEVIEGGSTGDKSLLWGIGIESTEDSLIANNYVHDLFDNGYFSHNSAGIMVNAFSHRNIIERNTVDVRGSSVYSAFGTKGGKGNDNEWRFNMAIGGNAGFFIISSTNDEFSPKGVKVHHNIAVGSKYLFEVDNHVYEGVAYNNTAYDVEAFMGSANVSVTNQEIYNNITVSTKYGLVYWGGYSVDGIPVKGFNSLLKYSDYNSVNGTGGYFAYRTAQFDNAVYETHSEWKSDTGFDKSTVTTSPGFVNPGGFRPEDYKRVSYPANGRDGSVMGAYETGNELIGFRYDGKAPPAPPRLLQ